MEGKVYKFSSFIRDLQGTFEEYIGYKVFEEGYTMEKLFSGNKRYKLNETLCTILLNESPLYPRQSTTRSTSIFHPIRHSTAPRRRSPPTLAVPHLRESSTHPPTLDFPVSNRFRVANRGHQSILTV